MRLGFLHNQLSRSILPPLPQILSEINNPRNPNSINSKKLGSVLVSSNSRITRHGRAGNLKEAQLVFDGMPFRDVISWTALLTAYAENGEISRAREVFEEMPKRNIASWNAMVSGYVRALKIPEAFELFTQMPAKNAVSYGTMITGFVNRGCFKEAEKMHEEMPRVWRDPVASNALICGYLRVGGLEEAVRVFEGMSVRDVVSWSSMVDGYCKCGKIDEAICTFEKMPERNVVSWTAMLRGYFKAGLWDDGFVAFLHMRREGMRINSTTVAVILDACSDLGRIREGVQIHGLVFMMGFNCDTFLGNSMIIMYSRVQWMDDAQIVFDYTDKKDIVSWNSIITGYVQSDMIEEALALFEKMPRRDVVSWTSMVVGFSSRGCLEEAICLFEEMPEKDDVAWTAIISGFVGNEEYESAFGWFNRMVQEGTKPNPIILSSLLSASAGLAILTQGMQVHACIIKMDLKFDVSVQNSLVSMYAKCGCLDDACRIFSSINNPTLVSMNSMITGFAQHGWAEKALELFKEMQMSGIKPNQVTFLGILSACSYAGLVEEGYHYFKFMSSFCIEPGPDHYTCMVDLLGRAGLLKEAVDLINSMPFQPHSAVWGALLSASSMHFDLKLAEVAAGRLFEMDPQNATAYAVLSNMYSLAGLKKDEDEIRMVKRSKGVRKNPGCSWIY